MIKTSKKVPRKVNAAWKFTSTEVSCVFLPPGTKLLEVSWESETYFWMQYSLFLRPYRYRLCFAAHICIIFFPVVAYRLFYFFMQQQQQASFVRPYKYIKRLQKRPSSIHNLFILESGNLERKDGRKNMKKIALTALNSIYIRGNHDWWSAFV